MASPLALAMMMPQANPPGQLQPTNTTAAYQLSQNAAEQNYQAQLAQNNAMWGGLAGLAGAGILAAPKAFGAGGMFAPGGAFGASTAAATSPFATAADAGTAGAGAIGTGGFNFLDAAAPSVADATATAAPSVAADIAADTVPAAADAAGSFSIADLIPALAGLFA